MFSKLFDLEFLLGEIMLQQVKKIIKRIIRHTPIEGIVGKLREKNILSGISAEDQRLITSICDKKLTYLSYPKLVSIVTTCRFIENNQLSGAFIEAGCALGGSSILIASLKSSGRPQFVYDVFGMIPSPTKDDTKDVHDRYQIIADGKSDGIEGDEYYGYMDDLYDVVQSNLNDFNIRCDEQNVSLVKGLIQDTMHIEKPVAFAHIDVDWYEPVKTCLERIFPNLVVGGSIILDDYHDYGGCRKATDEYLKIVVGQFVLDDSAGSMKITKK